MNKYVITALTSATIALAMITAAYLGGFFYGQKSHRDKELRQTIEALRLREKINEDIFNLDDIGLCLALDGLSDHCASRLRRMDKTAATE